MIISSRILPSPTETASFGTTQLRSNFLVDDLFQSGQIVLVTTDLDRAVVGGACPAQGQSLDLAAPAALASEYFCQRRELGIINLGGAGGVAVDGHEFHLEAREVLYVGRGSQKVSFSSISDQSPALFYLVSYPAHANYPTRKSDRSTADGARIGSKEEANERTLHKHIYEDGIPSCQLVMGYTEMAPGSMWNTMPSHTHSRRTEVYCYFDIPDGNAVFHMMGVPTETRHLLVANRQAVLSPAWSIHSGAGTKNYCFVWAMGGENQRFDDMDRVAIPDLR